MSSSASSGSGSSSTITRRAVSPSVATAQQKGAAPAAGAYYVPAFLPPSPPKSRASSPSASASPELVAQREPSQPPLLQSSSSNSNGGTARFRSTAGGAPTQHWNDLPASMATATVTATAMASSSGSSSNNRKGSLPLSKSGSREREMVNGSGRSNSAHASGPRSPHLQLQSHLKNSGQAGGAATGEGAGSGAKGDVHGYTGPMNGNGYANAGGYPHIDTGYGYGQPYQSHYADPHQQHSSGGMPPTPASSASASAAGVPFASSLYNRANEPMTKTTAFALPHSSSPVLPSSSAGLSDSHPRSHAHARRKSIAQHVVPSISTVRFVAYCTLWYTSSAVSNNTGKTILNHFRYPVTLTFVQFGFVAGWCIIFCVGRSKLAQWQRHSATSTSGHGHGHGRSMSVAQLYSAGGWGIKRPTRKHLEGTVVMSVFQIAGHIFSSMATARIPVSTVHTIKALSPLFTVMSYGLLFRVRYSNSTYISLLPLTLGVMLACSFDLRANAAGLICALGSTVIFVSQNIFSKKLLPQEGGHDGGHHGAAGGGDSGERKLDKLHLLLYSSGIAFLGMIPLWFYYDAYAVLLDPNPTHARSSSLSALFFYFTINGSVHFGQNLLAFSILSLTSPVTYSIASLIKRIAVICMAIVWFGQTVYPVQAVGISMTALGLWMYNQAKKDVERGEKKRVKVERRGSILLPSSREDALLGTGSDSDDAMAGTSKAKAKGWGIVR